MSPDRRQHRGPHAQDWQLFSPENIPKLRTAALDLAWLFSRGYSHNASLKLVGDRYGLRERQRLAVGRATCSDSQLKRRSASRTSEDQLAGRTVAIDGFNLLITVEAALSRGILIIGLDGCLRDLSSVHGSYRRVEETDQAIALVNEALERLRVSSAIWLLDQPVSNSGRLAARIRSAAEATGRQWTVDLAMNPDKLLPAAGDVVVSSDSVVLDSAFRWFDLARYTVQLLIPDAWIIDLRPDRYSKPLTSSPAATPSSDRL